MDDGAHLSDHALSDHALIDRIRSGDTAAFGLLYDRHSRAAYGLARRIGDSPDTAEAVVQEAFLLIWRQAATDCPDCGSVQAWLLSVVHHHAISIVRRQERRHHSHDLAPGLLGAMQMAPARPGSVSQEMHALLDRLSPDQRGAVILAYFGGYTHGDIARILELPPSRVKRELCRGLQILHSHLA